MEKYHEYFSNLQEIYVVSQNEKGTVRLVLDKETKQKLIIKEVTGLHSDVYCQLQQLTHNNMPKIHKVFDADNKYYIVQEYIIGVTLHEKLTEVKILSNKELKKYMLQLCNVLKFLHEQNPPILHRDIKPSNVMIASDDVIKLIDFDASRKTNTSAETDTKLLVTKGFAPPEQYGFSQTDCRADIYSVGMLMYTLLTGDSNGSIKSYKGKYKKIIRKCTKLDPKQRYSQISQLEKGLKKTLSIKHSICKFISIILSVIIISLSVLYSIDRQYPQNMARDTMQYFRQRQLPYAPISYISAVKDIVYITEPNNFYGYCFGKIFYENTVEWALFITDDNKKHVILTGIISLGSVDYYTEITFEIGDAISRPEIVKIYVPMVGSMTTKEEIDYFVYTIAFQYWDFSTEQTKLYLTEYFDSIFEDSELVLYENKIGGEYENKNLISFNLYVIMDNQENFLYTIFADKSTKEVLYLNDDTNELVSLWTPW